jgi:cysteinyl-tRNA synthetase
MMMSFDVVQRWLRVQGYAVTYVRNITDIDDKIIKPCGGARHHHPRADRRDDRAMHEDIAALGIEPPRRTNRAPPSTSAQMLDLIGKLEGKGLAYRAANGDVNYAVRKFDGYGKLSGKSLDELRAGERVAVHDGKLDPLDFVLWKHGQARGAGGCQVRLSVRYRPPGLAHRVLGHELRTAG